MEFMHLQPLITLILTLVSICQISEQQLNDAIAQAVENSKLKRDKSQWSINSKILVKFKFTFKDLFMPAREHFRSVCESDLRWYRIIALL